MDLATVSGDPAVIGNTSCESRGSALRSPG